MPPRSSHLLQPLDVGCFGPLKKAYGGQINQFSRARITHIDKTEFFPAFHAAHKAVFKPETIQGGFRGAGLIPFDAKVVLSKLDVNNSTQAVSQSTLIKDRISHHKESSLTPILTALNQLAEDAQSLAHALSLLTQENKTLREANAALSKRRAAKRTYLQSGGSLDTQEAREIISSKAKGKRPAGEMSGGADEAVRSGPTVRRCGNCGKPGHNARMCENDEEMSDVHSSD